MQSYNFEFLGKTDFLCYFPNILSKLITFAPYLCLGVVVKVFKSCPGVLEDLMGDGECDLAETCTEKFPWKFSI